MPTLKERLNLGMRTLLAFFPFLAKPDDSFAEGRLSVKEYDLYMQMDVRDRDHACAVAKAVLNYAPHASGRLIRAALLHDIGKCAARYNPFERIFVHLYTPTSIPAEPRVKGLRGSWQRRLHHARYGAEFILSAGGDPEVAEIVRQHHKPEGHAEAEILNLVEARF